MQGFMIQAFIGTEKDTLCGVHTNPDLNRGLYRERFGVVLSAPIRSYHVWMSILTIGLIVENFLAAKKIIPINTIASTIGTIASDRMTS